MTWRACAAVLAAGCVGNLDPEWQLNHDRVIAVRATPPGIAAGSASTLDALLAHKGAPVTDVSPTTAGSLGALPDLVSQGSDGSWIVTAPDEATLDDARAQLGIAAGSAVPYLVVVSFGSGSDALLANKTVNLGVAADNPALGAVTIDGSAVGSDDAIAIPSGVDVPFDIDEPTDDTVNWLTGCGTLHDDDEHAAFDNVGSDDPTTGQLVVVVRTPDEGVSWQIWPITATGSGSD